MPGEGITQQFPEPTLYTFVTLIVVQILHTTLVRILIGLIVPEQPSAIGFWPNYALAHVTHFT
jgi:hypothetical protein